MKFSFKNLLAGFCGIASLCSVSGSYRNGVIDEAKVTTFGSSSSYAQGKSLLSIHRPYDVIKQRVSGLGSFAKISVGESLDVKSNSLTSSGQYKISAQDREEEIGGLCKEVVRGWSQSVRGYLIACGYATEFDDNVIAFQQQVRINALKRSLYQRSNDEILRLKNGLATLKRYIQDDEIQTVFSALVRYAFSFRKSGSDVSLNMHTIAALSDMFGFDFKSKLRRDGTGGYKLNVGNNTAASLVQAAVYNPFLYYIFPVWMPSVLVSRDKNVIGQYNLLKSGQSLNDIAVGQNLSECELLEIDPCVGDEALGDTKSMSAAAA